MSKSSEGEKTADYLIPWYIVGAVAFVCAVALILIAVMGPTFLGIIQHRTSYSGTLQTIAFDVTDLLVLTPLLLIGGILELRKSANAKYFLVLAPITLIIVGLEYGMGQEWSNTAITGNVEAYSWLFLILITGGIILLIGTLSRFTPADAPNFKPKRLRIYVLVMAVFLLMFAVMWSSEIYQVVTTGNTTNGQYLEAPTSFWVVRFFDLGITIPLGFIALLLLLSKPNRAYPLILLFFGFFITLGTAVNASAVLLVINNDPSIAGSGAGGLVIFPVLGILAYAGLIYLVKQKLRRH
jgi:hypothetical protein